MGPGCTPGVASQSAEGMDAACGGLVEGVVVVARNVAAEVAPSCGEGGTQ